MPSPKTKVWMILPSFNALSGQQLQALLCTRLLPYTYDMHPVTLCYVETQERVRRRRRVTQWQLQVIDRQHVPGEAGEITIVIIIPRVNLNVKPDQRKKKHRTAREDCQVTERMRRRHLTLIKMWAEVDTWVFFILFIQIQSSLYRLQYSSLWGSDEVC